MSEDTPKYEMVEYIGKGGMGEVFRGVSHGADGFRRDVAIKRLRSARALDYDARRRFLEEAQLSAALDHPNIVPVFDYIKDKDGHVCLIMAFVDGIDLHDLMEAERLPVAVSVYIIGSVLAGLAHAHRHGIIHRDITPGNIMISRAGAVQITDFGLAHDTKSPGAPCEGGTPGFMSPEALQVESEDARSDLFSVGVVLYELLTGTRAFPGTRRFDRIVQTLSKPPPPPIEIRPELPRLLSDITMRLLAKDPADRFASAVEVIDALPLAKYGSEDLAALIEERKPPRRPAVGVSSEDKLSTKPFKKDGTPGEPADHGKSGTLWEPAHDGKTASIPEPVPVAISDDPDIVVKVLDSAAPRGKPPGRTMTPVAAKPAIASLRPVSPADEGNRLERTPSPPGRAGKARTGRRLPLALTAAAALLVCGVIGQRALHQGQPSDRVTAPSTAREHAASAPQGGDLVRVPETTPARRSEPVAAQTEPSTAHPTARRRASRTRAPARDEQVMAAGQHPAASEPRAADRPETADRQTTENTNTARRSWASGIEEPRTIDPIERFTMSMEEPLSGEFLVEEEP